MSGLKQQNHFQSAELDLLIFVCQKLKFKGVFQIKQAKKNKLYKKIAKFWYKVLIFSSQEIKVLFFAQLNFYILVHLKKNIAIYCNYEYNQLSKYK